jgi:hypothetical protein
MPTRRLCRAALDDRSPPPRRGSTLSTPPHLELALVFTAPRGRAPGTQPVQPTGLEAGRHPCWDPQHHLPRLAPQLCGNPGRGWL